MIGALEPLADLPGVDLVLFLTDDGVPIGVRGKTAEEEQDQGFSREDALAALAANWHSEVSAAAGQMSWDCPQRIVLRCARGTLVLTMARGAILLVLLARGQAAEHFRLAIDGTIARIERSLRGGETTDTGPGDLGRGTTGVDDPPAPFASRPEASADGDLQSTDNRSTAPSEG